jgi:hypothetical protein
MHEVPAGGDKQYDNDGAYKYRAGGMLFGSSVDSVGGVSHP